MTMPLPTEPAWTLLSVGLWTFAALSWLDWITHVATAARAGRPPRSSLLSRAGITKVAAAAAPVPFGLRATQVWPVATLAWTMRPVATSPGLPQLAGVMAPQAEALRIVMVLFVFVMVLAAVVLHAAEGAGQHDGFGTLAMCAGLGLIGLFTHILASGFEAEGRRCGFPKVRALLSRMPFLKGLGCGVVGDMARQNADFHTIADRYPDQGQAVETEAAT